MGSILKEIKQYPFEEDVLIEADQVNKRMKPHVNRGKKRNLKLLFCVYNAYLNLNRVADIYLLGKIMNIDPKKVKDAFKICSPLKSGYKYKKVRFNVFDYLELYMSHIKLLKRDHQTHVLHLAHTIMDKTSELESYPRQKLAASFIIYYSKINGYDEVSKIMKELFYRPTTTLELIIKKIGDLNNM